MTISELIERLEALKAQDGDLQVVIYDERDGLHLAPELESKSIGSYWDAGVWSTRIVVLVT